MLIQLDPCIAKAPIILGQEKPDDNSVVKWIREEFTELNQVRNDCTEWSRAFWLLSNGRRTEKALRLKTLALSVMIPLRLFKRRSMRANIVPDTSEVSSLHCSEHSSLRGCVDLTASQRTDFLFYRRNRRGQGTRGVWIPAVRAWYRVKFLRLSNSEFWNIAILADSKLRG